jgi:TetR/AcrR family transcriptional regulator, ethionamide resistance regulator
MPKPTPGPARAQRRASVQPLAALNPRGLRSRERLKRAARELLNERGFHSLRVQDVTERAGVATGLFYRYFHDLREIVGEISQDFFAELLADVDGGAPGTHRYDWIYRTLHDAVGQFARNPGILACLFGLAGDYAEYDQIWKQNAHRWNLRVAQYLRRETGCDAARARRMGFMLGAMTEGVIYQTLIRRTEDLSELAGKPEDIADVLATMWYRAIYLEDPPRARLRAAGRRLLDGRSQRRPAARRKKT